MRERSESVRAFTDRIYSEDRRQFACRARTADEFAAWQKAARPAYRALLRLETIEQDAAGNRPVVDLSADVEDMGVYTRRQGHIETEPGVWVHLWVLRPKHEGPCPLALMPHGHGPDDQYIGLARTEAERQQIENEDRDVAVQAVQRGYLAIVPSTRGIGQNARSFVVSDPNGRHDGRDCRCHAWHAIAAGRVTTGERVWDMMRILDWALDRPDVDTQRVLMMGNSGGGMVTLHTAALDERVTLAVASCSFTSYLGRDHVLRHCPCNLVPGFAAFGEYWDVAGLVAPRCLLTVNGTQDELFPAEEVKHAAARVAEIYAVAGVPDRYRHNFGTGGHRFYKDLMWPVIGGWMR